MTAALQRLQATDDSALALIAAVAAFVLIELHATLDAFVQLFKWADINVSPPKVEVPVFSSEESLTESTRRCMGTFERDLKLCLLAMAGNPGGGSDETTRFRDMLVSGSSVYNGVARTLVDDLHAYKTTLLSDVQSSFVQYHTDFFTNSKSSSSSTS